MVGLRTSLANRRRFVALAGLDANRFANRIPLISLFASGENGFLFDGFADTGRLFDTAAAVSGSNVDGDGDAVAFAFDNSAWSGNSLAQVSAAAAQMLTDPGFDNAGSWTLTQATVSSSVLTVNSPTGSYAAAVQNIAGLTVGAFYELTAVVDSVTRGSPTLGFSGGSAAVVGATVGTAKGYLAATATTHGWELKRNQSVDTLFVASSGTMKRIVGNHFTQATAANRPVWKTGAKPYLQFDGSNDCLLTPGWKPGQAATVAVAFRHNAAAAGYAFGAGTATGNKRLRLGIDATGRPELSYNDQFVKGSASNFAGVDVVLIATYDATGYALYLDGVQVATAALAPNMDGTGGQTCLGSTDGGGSSFLSGNVYAALALNRRATPAEIANINATLRNRIP